MSATEIDTGQPRRSRTNELAILLAFLAVVGGAALFFTGDRDRPLRQSAIGFDGLVAWLKANGIVAQSVTHGFGIDPDKVGLRIQPLFDTDLNGPRIPPKSEEDLIRQGDEIDLSRAVLLQKIEALPTLVVLPKWRTGMRLSKAAHPDLALGDARQDDGNRPRGWTSSHIGGGAVTYAKQKFQDFRVGDGPGRHLRARLYWPQVIVGSDCAPIIGDADVLVLGECETPEGRYWILSDPDLLNSHGLALADNAAIAARLLPELADGGAVIVDYSTIPWAAIARKLKEDGETEPDDRDLPRLLTYPFTLIWVGVSLLLALVLWRALVRTGPIVQAAETAYGASTTAGIGARARLLRLSGEDGNLLRAHLADRQLALAEQMVGRSSVAPEHSLTRIVAVIRQRNPRLAEAYEYAVRDLDRLAPDVPTDTAADALYRFETVYRQVMHEFGRTA